MTVRTIDEIFRDFVTDGVPASGPFNPHKPDIRDTLKALTEGGDNFPDNRVIRLNNADEGTANNIVVMASVVIPAAAYQVLYILNVTQENTGPVTVSGAINRDLVTNISQPVPAGYLIPGMALLCIDTGTELRLLSYGDAEAILAAAEDAAARAEAAAAGVNLPELTSGNANKVLTVKPDGSGYDVKLVSEANVTNAPNDALRITIGNIANPARYGTYDPTGVADSTAAINAALSSKKYVELGEGDFRISSKVVIGSSYRMLKGYAPGITRLLSYSAANPVIEIAAGLEGINIDGFTVAHAVTPTDGGNGITALGDLAMSSIKRMNAVANYIGMTLRSTGYSKLEEIFLSNNLGDGLVILNTAGHAACQWYIDDVLSQANGGRGAFVQSIPGASGLLLGDWSRFRTFANSGFGIALLGTASEPVQAFRLHESFLGSDGGGELYLDTYGFGHKIHDTFFERSGLDPTGPTLTTPASGIGWGIQATANNTDFRVDNSSISYCSQGGVYSEAGKLRLTTVFFDHLTAGVNVANGNTYREVGCDFTSVTTPRTIVANPQGAIIVGSDTGSAGANPTRIPGGITVGNAVGGDPGAGLVNVAGGLLKNNVAYNNP